MRYLRPDLRPKQIAPKLIRMPKVRPSYSPSYIENLAAVIAREGIKAPILIDGSRVIHSGMALWLAALRLNLKVVPVAWLDAPRGRRVQKRGAVL